MVLNAFFQAGPGEKQKNIKRNERKTTILFVNTKINTVAKTSVVIPGAQLPLWWAVADGGDGFGAPRPSGETLALDRVVARLHDLLSTRSSFA